MRTVLTFHSGLERLPPLPGASTPAATAPLAATVLLVVVHVAHPRAAVVNLILLAAMTVVIAITTAVTVIVPEARMIAIATAT